MSPVLALSLQTSHQDVINFLGGHFNFILIYATEIYGLNTVIKGFLIKGFKNQPTTLKKDSLTGLAATAVTG